MIDHAPVSWTVINDHRRHDEARNRGKTPVEDLVREGERPRNKGHTESPIDDEECGRPQGKVLCTEKHMVSTIERRCTIEDVSVNEKQGAEIARIGYVRRRA